MTLKLTKKFEVVFKGVRLSYKPVVAAAYSVGQQSTDRVCRTLHWDCDFAEPLVITVRGYTQCGIITTKLQYEAQMFNPAQNCHTKHYTPHCRVAHVIGCSSFLPKMCRVKSLHKPVHEAIYIRSTVCPVTHCA